jgi:rhomboid protease GluP
MSDTDENASTPWEELVKVGTFPSLEKAHEHGLVILAMGEACWVAEADDHDGYSLLVEPSVTVRVSRELRDYDQEQDAPAPKPPLPQEIFRYPAGWDVAGIWVFCVLMFFFWQNKDPMFVERAASSSTGLIRDLEWWRPFTALFLHADPQHLIGNILSGLLFGTLVSRSLGPWRGWALILASGTAGNAITSAFTYPESFVSLGASTAVFGALGILSGLGFAAMLRSRIRLPLAKTTAPIIAGIVLLGMMGGGGPGGNTDVLGHIFGFASGLAIGLIAMHRKKETDPAV